MTREDLQRLFALACEVHGREPTTIRLLTNEGGWLVDTVGLDLRDDCILGKSGQRTVCLLWPAITGFVLND